MKNGILIFFVLLTCSISLSGQFKVGAGLETNFDVLGIKGQVHYQFSEQWGGQVGIGYYFSDFNPSMLNFDAHYLLVTIGNNEEVKLNAIGGFNYWSSGVEGAGGELGINLGANINFPITDSLDAFIEPKVTAISIGDVFISFGIYF